MGGQSDGGLNADNGFDAAQNIIDTANKYDVDPDFALRIAHQESGINPNVKDSSAGAIGIMQLMPGTAKGLGVDPRDPAQNIDGGVRYIKQLQDQLGPDISARSPTPTTPAPAACKKCSPAIRRCPPRRSTTLRT